jgi:hypothetical protein
LNRRLIFSLAGAALALLMHAGLAQAQAPAGDSVVANASAEDPILAAGQIGCCHYDFAIDAHSGPSGESPAGSVTVQFIGRDLPAYSFSGHVSCLAVSGTTAVIGVIVDQSDGDVAPVVGQGVTLFATDTHGPVTGALFDPQPPDADRFADQLSSSGCPAFPAPPTSDALYYVYNGDIVIRDAQPFPTSKDQCKNGGWRNFPGFKNQGDCVSWVATGGKNPPVR